MPGTLFRPRTVLLALAAVVAMLPAAHAYAAEPRLASYNADIAQTSVSGISSGAYMAVQFGTAWSSTVMGVGAIAGGPFGCSEGSGSAALSTCMGGAPAPDLAAFIKRTDAWSKGGQIDSTTGIAAQKIYLFNGYNDAVVARGVTNALQGYYRHYLGPNQANLFYQTAIGAGHSQVTANYGGACAANGGEYINNCHYDQAGILLQHIYGALAAPTGGPLTGQLLSFDQGEFTAPARPTDDSMDDKGFVYVPAACAAAARCRVHIALHGCLQSVGAIGEDYVRHAGYNEWADSNAIIVLYPQIHAVTLTALGITNPQGCWDWWGYLDANPMVSPTYLLKSGKQVMAIKAMLDRVTGGGAGAAAAGAPASAAPAVLRATDASDTAIDLAWTPVAGAAAYEVFRAGPADADFRRVGSVAGPSFGDAGLKAATGYRYEVRVAGMTAFSPVATGRTLRTVPRCVEPGTCAVR